MQTHHILWSLLWSALVLAVAVQKSPTVFDVDFPTDFLPCCICRRNTFANQFRPYLYYKRMAFICPVCAADLLTNENCEEKKAATPNEFQCPVCQNQTKDNCTEVVSCQGDENFCANSTVKILNKDNTENSTHVILGCVPELVLSALLGKKDVEPDFIYDIQSVIETAPRRPTNPPTTAKPTEKPGDNPTKTIPEKSNSPHISGSLSFALWLPSMFWLLLMMLLS